jgi:hypothetical protein
VVAPVPGSEHVSYDEFRGTEVSAFAKGYGGPAEALRAKAGDAPDSFYNSY